MSSQYGAGIKTISYDILPGEEHLWVLAVLHFCQSRPLLQQHTREYLYIYIYMYITFSWCFCVGQHDSHKYDNCNNWACQVV